MADFQMENYINEDTIIEDDIYSNFKDSVICGICSNILIKPIMCMNCQNAYCQKCINDWSKRDNRCPYHCENPSYKKSIEKSNILSKLKFKCDKCDGEILYDNVKKHSEICKSEKVQKINIARLKKLDRNEVKGINDKEKKDITYITCKS